MKHYLIDLENVQKSGFVGIENINEPSVIYVFMTDKTCDVSNEIKKNANSFFISWKFERAVNGPKDSLDIQLGFILGLIINQNSKDSFYIISKDLGYSGIVDSSKAKGYKVSLHPSIAASMQKQPKVEPKCGENNKSTDSLDSVLKMLSNCDNLNEVYTAIVKKWGQEKGRKIYTQHKSSLKAKFKQAKSETKKAVPQPIITKEELRKYLKKDLLTTKKITLVTNAINNRMIVSEIQKEIEEIYKMEPQRGEKVFAELQRQGVLKVLGKR